MYLFILCCSLFSNCFLELSFLFFSQGPTQTFQFNIELFYPSLLGEIQSPTVAHFFRFVTRQENLTDWKRKHTNCYMLLTADDQEQCGQLFLAKKLVDCPHTGWVSLVAYQEINVLPVAHYVDVWLELKSHKKINSPKVRSPSKLQIVFWIETKVVYFKSKLSVSLSQLFSGPFLITFGSWRDGKYSYRRSQITLWTMANVQQ